MNDPVWLFIRSRFGREYATLEYDPMPGVRDKLVFSIRLDTLPDGGDWLSMSLTELHNAYRNGAFQRLTGVRA